jgi:hypothetical protein
MPILNCKPGPVETLPGLRRLGDRGRWETIRFAIERTDRTLRLCAILIVTGSISAVLLAILISR